MASTSKTATRVAIIDPQPMYRAGISRILSGQPSIRLAGEGGSLADAVALARLKAVDVMILDVTLDTEFTAIASIRAAFPEMALIAVGGGAEIDTVAVAMRAGVRACLPRSVDGPGLLDAIARVSRGELYVAPSMGWQLLSRLTTARAVPRSGAQAVQFTSREEEIMHLVASGATNKEVARNLAVSVKTVKHHLTNVMQKLRVRNRVEAVVAYQARNRAPRPALDVRAVGF